ncbi:MAG: bifunctional UDP-N-acetylglucosamine diphosphorylase/glucosamine-1-phosphate N-acetyltransferase GlmU [Rubrivivax sp.]|nr:bifunctional UDP-N-acetylglucosamine diphosphorylase/glucosamine-1-phosphate N-acetyltransferase GlmU [Rubrivivax sp.]
MALNVVIMAAGKGTRMKSAIPKVLHRIAGTSLLEHVMRTATTLGSSRTVVITGHEAAQVEASLAGRDVQFVRQEPQLGTGHAVQQAVPALPDAHETTLVLNGDVPLIGAATVQRLIDACGGRRLALLTIELADPTGYGRVVRAGDAVRAIVEHKDAKPEQLAIRETYTGVMAAPTALLKRWVMALKNDNKQREYYLTDVVAAAVAEGVPVVAEHATSETEVAGVNSPLQLAELERAFQRAQAEALMEAGVRLADPARLDVRGTLTCGADVEIDVGCIFEGRVHLADGVRIGAHCVIRDSRIGAGTQVQPFTHMREAVVGERAEVGPFARLRPGADLGPEVHIGNFVEVKNSTLAAGAKANHLAYLGDATVGARVNYGAGSITANYDGANKHRTVIGDDAHIGSNCVLVAPVTIGAGATIGGGSTINKDAPAGQLTVARAKQMSLSGWKRPQKAKKA